MNAVDREALLFLNHLVGQSATAFNLALFLCGQVPLTACVMVLLTLWWTDVDGRKQASVLGVGTASAPRGVMESRRRCVALTAAIAAAFVSTRLIAFTVNIPRALVREELQVPIDPALWDEFVRNMTGFGAFPSDHAALFFALAAGLFAWSGRAGWIGVAFATLFSLARVATGFHYPSDILVGGSIGAVAAATARALAPRVRGTLDLVVGLFDQFPAAMYPMLFIAALDFTHHFRLLLGAVFAVIFQMLGFAGAA